MKEKLDYFKKLCESEIFHYNVFKKLAEIEKDASIKSTLEKLADEELKHSRIWKEIPGVSTRKYKENRFAIALIPLVKALAGLELTVKIMEYEEVALEKKLDREIKELDASKKEKETIKKIKDSESKTEDHLKEKLLGYSPVLNNIRSIILGMNDGLVEILGAVAGFAAAIHQPLLVLVAGIIVVIAGTLSMAGGSYLSIEYERSVYKTKKTDSPMTSALYTGVAYIIGSAFPLLPFIFGLSGYYALAISIIVTGIVLTFASILISIVSDTSITHRILRTLIISLGIVAITITLGIYARGALHINV